MLLEQFLHLGFEPFLLPVQLCPGPTPLFGGIGGQLEAVQGKVGKGNNITCCKYEKDELCPANSKFIIAIHVEWHEKVEKDLRYLTIGVFGNKQAEGEIIQVSEHETADPTFFKSLTDQMMRKDFLANVEDNLSEAFVSQYYGMLEMSYSATRNPE